MTQADDPPPLCTYLEWDSAFFGRHIARLNPHHIDPTSLKEALKWCKSNQIDCLYFLADCDDVQTVRLVERDGFLLTDVRTTLERAISAPDAALSQECVRCAREEDMATLRSIAQMAHRDSRFYFDGHFEQWKCDLFYETWLEKSFHGFAEAVLVAEEKGQPAGYLTCDLPTPQKAQIGIIGVGHAYQGSGIGRKLVRQFLAWSAQQGVQHAMVVTQGRNVRAQRLYQRNGFVTTLVQLWFHRWFTD